MKIEASDIDVSKLLKMGIIVIPRFQRPYSWKSDNIREFWNDITGSEDSGYFIGSMVIYSMKQDRFGVVDGQQRLTTITILLCAIRDQFAALGEKDLASGVHNYIETRDRDNVKSFILKTETSFPYLQDKIQRFGEPELEVEPREEEHRLQQAYNTLHKFVEEYIRKASDGLLAKTEKVAAKVNALKELREIVFNLKVIKIELDDEDNAYIIFETLNTRGQDLTLSDLLKNSIGSLIAKDGDVDVLKVNWDAISGNIGRCGDSVKLESFFVHSWTSRFPAVTKQKAFKAFKDRLKESIASAGEGSSRGIAISHLKAFKTDSDRYAKIYNPIGSFSKYQYVVADALATLRIFNVEQQTPYVLALLRAFDEKKIAYRTLRRALLSVENFHFQFNAVTSQRSSGTIASMYTRAARSLSDAADSNGAGQVIAAVTVELRDRAPKLEEFSLGFRNLSYSVQNRSNALIKYVLTRMSTYEGLHFDVELDRLTIEHLYPQSTVGGDWSAELINSIGNLILLSEARNNALENKAYEQKHAILLGWGQNIPKFVRAAPQWTPDILAERANEMAAIAHNAVWKI
jgi:uncharacterized protein with ParB-like and HNH nuclease domain